jgi:hypothetical protein
MRTALASFLLALAFGCSTSEHMPKVERIEMRLSGWSAVDVEVNSQGQGRYHLSKRTPNGASGSFSIPPRQFASLVERLRPFQQQAVPFTDESARGFIDMACPKGMPFTTDQGAVWVHWIGPNSDQHYLADLGCDAERNGARNEKLLGIMRSLPIPLASNAGP